MVVRIDDRQIRLQDRLLAAGEPFVSRASAASACDLPAALSAAI